VFVLHLDDGENRFTHDSVAELSRLIAVVEATSGPKALVTVGEGKFWSNGLDLDWLTANKPRASALLLAVHDLFAQVLAAGVPTVAAIQGHCYAAGAMLALAHDIRIMREDRGYFCLPEIDLRLAFTPGMSALVSSKLTPQVAHQAMAFGRRYGGVDAASLAIVDETATESDILPRAIAVASALAGKDSATLATIKRTLYAPVLSALRETDANSKIDGIFSS
jgi:enoyl-CoA hydratase/carnithine racemase